MGSPARRVRLNYISQTPDIDDASKAAPGWYPVGGKLRYWNGSNWTDRVKRERSNPSPVGIPIDLPRGMVVLGGLALAISPFLTWVNAILLGSLNLFDALQITGRSEDVAWIAVSMGGFVTLVAVASTNKRLIRSASTCIGLVSGAGSLWVLNSLTSDVRVVDGLAQLSYGPWVAILGCCSILGGGLLTKSKRTREAGSE